MIIFLFLAVLSDFFIISLTFWKLYYETMDPIQSSVSYQVVHQLRCSSHTR